MLCRDEWVACPRISIAFFKLFPRLIWPCLPLWTREEVECHLEPPKFGRIEDQP